MPTTAAEVFSAARLTAEGVLRWGARPPTRASGVYVVALTDSLDSVEGVFAAAPLDAEVFETWLAARPELTLDGTRPSVEQLMTRIQGFWLPDEAIVYVGLATSLSSRLDQYYKTPIGARRPHAGGYFLKLLANLDRLWVHYVTCSDPEAAESAMLKRFCENVSEDTKRSLVDPAHPFPFGNLEWPRGVRKAHGIVGAREPRVQQAASDHSPPYALAPALRPAGRGSFSTQRVTATDLRAGRIRIPSSGSASTKTLFPSQKAPLRVTLKGRSVDASWDPRMGPDKERSGVLTVGPSLRELVAENEVLVVREEDGILVMI